MNTWYCVSLALGVLSLILLFLLMAGSCRDGDVYTAEDIHHAHRAIDTLDQMKSKGQEPPEMDERDLDRLAPKIHLAMIKSEPIVDAAKEGYDSYQFPRWPPATLKSLYEAGLPINRYYTNWPPEIFDRLFEWYPGFQTSGWSTWLRSINRFGNQAFWVKNQGSYFFIRN